MTRATCLLVLTLAAGCSSRPEGPLTAGGRPVSHWLDELRSPDPKARKKAVRELGHVGKADPAAIPAVTGALKDPDPQVRAEAALALLNLGPAAAEAVPALEEVRNDSDPAVRSYVHKALERIRGS